MTLHLTWMSDGTFKNDKDGTKYNLVTLGHQIREGNHIIVKDYEIGVDYTKETLVKIAFQGALHQGTKYDTDFTLVEMISEVITEETLYEIIEHGNMEQYIVKKRRGAIR